MRADIGLRIALLLTPAAVAHDLVRCAGGPKCNLGLSTVMHQETSSGCQEICVVDPSKVIDFDCGYCDGKESMDALDLTSVVKLPLEPAQRDLQASSTACQRTMFVDARTRSKVAGVTTSGEYKLYETTAPVSTTLKYDKGLFMGHRWGYGFTVTLTGFEPGCTSRMSLGFAEIFPDNCAVGKRVSNITVNGRSFVSNLDVFQKVGCNTGHVETRTMRADSKGRFIVKFIPSVNNPMMSFLQIGNAKSPLPISKPGTITYVPGDLTVQQDGLLLSKGLAAKLIGSKGMPVSYSNGGQSTALFHSDPDAGGVFPDPNPSNPGGWIYVSNAEVQPFNGVPEGLGGVGAFTFNKDGQIIDYRMVLERTTSNCSGGRTPWNSWVSCEEFDRGQCWQVDPTGSKSPQPITMTNTDRGRFEAFASDVRNKAVPRFFVTKDDEWGELRRYTPTNPNWNDPWSILHGTGTLEYLTLTPSADGNSGTYAWVSDRFTGSDNARVHYPYAEGIDVSNNQLLFVCKKVKQMFVLNLDGNTYTRVSTQHGLFDGEPDQVQRILGSTSGLLYFTEDGGEYAGVHARNPQGQFFSILESHLYADETTGLAFSPDGRFMYIAYQDNGLLFQVWREDGLSFDAKSLNVKFHAI